IPHFHTISQKHQKVVGQTGFRPEIKRLIQWLSPSELAGDINIIEEAAESVMRRVAIQEFSAQHRVHLRGECEGGLHPAWNKTEKPPNSVQVPAISIAGQCGPPRNTRCQI